MTPQDLENIERQYDKARNAGPQAVADWAAQHAVTLFAGVRLGFDVPISLRARGSGAPVSDDPANDAPAFNYGDPRRITDALRPFAALGAPVCLTALEEHRILNDVPDDVPAFAVPDPNGPGALASVTADQLKTAHDLINEIDGGGGA